MTDTTNAANSSPITAGDAGNSWELVPAAPTPEMIEAWNNSGADDFKIKDPNYSEFTAEEWAEWKRRNATLDWSAMLAAAPQPQGGALTDEQRVALTRLADRIEGAQETPIAVSLESASIIRSLAQSALSAPQQAGNGLTEAIRTRLARFEECAQDDADVDIGRDWFDALTTLGLLERVQRSPARWEMTDAGRAILAAPRQPATFDAEALIRACVPGGSICDPQQVADAIRAYAAPRQPGEMGAGVRRYLTPDETAAQYETKDGVEIHIGSGLPKATCPCGLCQRVRKTDVAASAQQVAQEVLVDFDQVGTAGPFPLADGRVLVPAVTVLDLVRMVPSALAQQDDPRMIALAAAEQQVHDAATRRKERAERFGLAAQQDEREAVILPAGFSIKRIDEHGWVIDPPCGSRWVAHEGTPAGDFLAALIAAQQVQVQAGAGAVDYRKRFETMVYMLGEITQALGISDDDAACANGNDLILAAIAEVRQQVQADAGAVAQELSSYDYAVMADAEGVYFDGDPAILMRFVRKVLAAHPSPAGESDKRDASYFRWLRGSAYNSLMPSDDYIRAAMSREQSKEDGK